MSDAENQGAAPGPQTMTVAQAAAMCQKSVRWVQNLTSAGWIAQEKRGEYIPINVVRGAIAYYEDKIAQNSKAAAASRATDARTREIEMRMAERARKLVPIEDSMSILAEVVQMTRAEFGGLPARYTRDMAERRRLEKEIDDSFSRLERTASQRREALASGSFDMEAG